MTFCFTNDLSGAKTRPNCRRTFKGILALFVSAILSLFHAEAYCQTEFSPNEVYTQVLLIEKETELMEARFGQQTQTPVWRPVQFDAEPRHVWMAFYALQMKVVAFRGKEGLVRISPVNMEPIRDLDPSFNWLQSQRTLAEIRFIRKRLDIPGDIGSASNVNGKRPIDVYNKLMQIQTRWDAMLGDGFSFDALTFAQALRLNEDVNTVMRLLKVIDNAVLPVKNPSSAPEDSISQAFLVLEQLQRLQRNYGLVATDFTPLRQTNKATVNQTFNLVCLALAEMQQLKAQLGLSHIITPPANYYETKTAADVGQLLAYIGNKLLLIRS